MPPEKPESSSAGAQLHITGYDPRWQPCEQICPWAGSSQPRVHFGIADRTLSDLAGLHVVSSYTEQATWLSL